MSDCQHCHLQVQKFRKVMEHPSWGENQVQAEEQNKVDKRREPE
jgi:hypothetical protein